MEQVCCRAHLYHASEQTNTLQSVSSELSAYFNENLNVLYLISDSQFILSSIGQSFVFFFPLSSSDLIFRLRAVQRHILFFIFFIYIFTFLEKFLIAAFFMIYEWKSSDYASSAPSDALEEHKRE